MIKFKHIKAKNFGSYGNYFTTIDLDSHSTTLVVGKNGSGKSTLLLDGIFFVLFNRPYRKITKSLLVNSINKGGTLVEIEFETRGSLYTVRRGIKPNIFEIEKDGTLLDQNVLSKDTQLYLEEDILQTNLRTFGQTSILGTSSFVPFMQLPAAGRREVVDDVLDVHVFTTMSDLAKEDLSITNKSLTKTENDLLIVKNKFTSQKEIIKVMESGQQDIIDQLEEQNSTLEEEIFSNNEILEELKEELDQISFRETKDISKSRSDYQLFSSEIQSLKSVIKRIDSLELCPTCFQTVDSGHKDQVLLDTNKKISDLEIKLSSLKSIIDSEDIVLEENSKLIEKSRDLKNKIQNCVIFTNQKLKTQKDVIEKIAKAKANSSDKVDGAKEVLKKLAEEGKLLSKEIDSLKQQKAIQELSVKLLKDNGIKASIVKEYLPIINRLINLNLIEYGFDINFNLNESFEESVVSMGREDFKYNSFSEGEKEKIDYSIMLALREVGVMKNASNFNILILDEILDGSLDKESRSITLDILTKNNEESNVFVISHTESQPTFYERVLKVSKHKNFSHIESE